MSDILVSWRINSSAVAPFLVLAAALIIFLISDGVRDPAFPYILLLLALGALAGYEQTDVLDKHPELREKHRRREILIRRISQLHIVLVVIGLWSLWWVTRQSAMT